MSEKKNTKQKQQQKQNGYNSSPRQIENNHILKKENK